MLIELVAFQWKRRRRRRQRKRRCIGRRQRVRIGHRRATRRHRRQLKLRDARRCIERQRHRRLLQSRRRSVRQRRPRRHAPRLLRRHRIRGRARMVLHLSVRRSVRHELRRRGIVHQHGVGDLLRSVRVRIARSRRRCRRDLGRQRARRGHRHGFGCCHRRAYRRTDFRRLSARTNRRMLSTGHHQERAARTKWTRNCTGVLVCRPRRRQNGET
jgi:hypothetical protein